LVAGAKTGRVHCPGGVRYTSPKVPPSRWGIRGPVCYAIHCSLSPHEPASTSVFSIGSAAFAALMVVTNTHATTHLASVATARIYVHIHTYFISACQRKHIIYAHIRTVATAAFPFLLRDRLHGFPGLLLLLLSVSDFTCQFFCFTLFSCRFRAVD